MKIQLLVKNFSIIFYLLPERPINTLEELAEAMKNENYQLLIEENSASHSMLEVNILNDCHMFLVEDDQS